MPPKVIHELWTLIDVTQTALLLGLSDIELAQWLTQQLQCRGTVQDDDVNACQAYIRCRLPLIRDVVRDRTLLYQ